MKLFYRSFLVVTVLFVLGQCKGACQFAKVVGEVKEVTLWEGLPHQRFEAKVLKQELAKKTYFKIAGFPFYKEKLTFSKEDLANLQALLQKEDNYSPSSFFPKSCGGFHPDFALEFEVEKVKYKALVCFGCNEVEVFEGSYRSTFDLQMPDVDKVKAILKKYSKNRPPTELF
ncbi:MAG: hypothetical protein AAF518_03525 [Spirochaetota bacterium]